MDYMRLFVEILQARTSHCKGLRLEITAVLLEEACTNGAGAHACSEGTPCGRGALLQDANIMTELLKCGAMNKAGERAANLESLAFESLKGARYSQ